MGTLLITGSKDMESMWIKVSLFIKGNGITMRSMVMVKNSLMMEQYTAEIMLEELKMDRECSYHQMALSK